MDEARQLQALARLDTCVTVVDAYSFLDNLHDVSSLRERAAAAAAAAGAPGGAEEVDDEDDRGVAELLIDQAGWVPWRDREGWVVDVSPAAGSLTSPPRRLSAPG